MKLFVMNEGNFWRYEFSRAGITPARLSILCFAFGLLFFAGLVLSYWLAENVSFQEAWQKMGAMALTSAAGGVAVAVAGVLLQEWSYRRTRALSPSVRGFDIDTRPTDLADLERVRGRAALAFDGPQRRDWERTRSHGMAAFVMRWFAIILAVEVGLLLFLSLLPGSGRLSPDHEWGELAWIFGFWPLAGIALGVGLWFLGEWSYRKGKAAT